MYQVLARTWRPQSFDELVGQNHVARTLANAIQAERLAHAYLFAGLRGTGKTTVARILAKCLNCEKGPTIHPCGKCAACVEIAECRALDVMEIDAASRTKVEQTREILEMISYAPVRDRYKVLIIDEAHMLSKHSFNALLKTIEEPPPRVVFILATTELQKVPPTILSRCQVFEFRRIGVPELSLHLRRIAETEGIDASDTSLERIARAGEGSVRDSLSVLERVLAFCGKKAEDEDVIHVLGGVRNEVLVEFIRSLAERSAAGMLTVLDGLVDEGHDLVHFWSELIAAMRDLLLLAALPARRELLSRSAEEAEALEAAARGLSRDDLTRAFQLLADLETALKASSQPRFLFEAALIRLSSLGAVRPIEELLDSLAREAPVAPPAIPRAPEQKKKGAEAGFSTELLSAIHGARPMVGAMLAQAQSLSLGEGCLSITLPAGMDALKRQLERPENLGLIRQQAEALAGYPLKVRVEAAPGNPQRPADAKADPRRETQGPSAKGAASAGLLDEARNEPGVRKLLDAFEAQVVEIRPLEARPNDIAEREAPGPVEGAR